MIRYVPIEEFISVLSPLLDEEKTDTKGRKRLIREYISPPEEDRYDFYTPYLTDDNRAGFLIEEGPTRRLSCLFSLSDKYHADDLIDSAWRVGAIELDCFDEDDFLPSLYRRNEWEEFDRVPWDDQYAPKVWNGDRPDVVYMRKIF